jgi:3'-phosphoadenosine 5'-phosphosulfate sulfotransferase (PAPS reductase)/FAD synthetase
LLYYIGIKIKEDINMTVNTFIPVTTGLLSEEDIATQEGLVAAFFDGVDEIKSIVTSGRVIAHGPVSQGKDSTVVELMLIEAYRQLVESSEIEPNRPLIISTVDTLNEAIPMKMYTQYCKRRVEDYARSQGVNLFYDIVTPSLNDEYFIKYTGGQKLIPNASRRGDCSIILKVDPSEKYVKTQLDRFDSMKGMEGYRDSTVVSFVGSRTNEGSRRSNNMRKQGIRGKGVDALLLEISGASTARRNGTTKRPMLRYAPIRDWHIDDVFDLLRLAGDKPVTRMLSGRKAPIPAFLSNFGLLLEIYGNGSNDVCEITIGNSKQGAGCNGKARYGCWNCTMIASTDHSSTALTEYVRWNILGADSALRVRDYLFRLSCDMGARALHARSFDPAGYNRVTMQPNVMKPKYLDKMVRYASQLTVDSIKQAEEFKALVAEGREDEHPGYAEIKQDINIPPKARKAFLEMYKECAQEPIFTSFSEKHAILLSFRWSIDGIGAAPYRPLAIWEQVKRGEGRIPYPMLNKEYEARFGKIKMIDAEKPLPEAVMMPIYRVEDPKAHAKSAPSLYDLWERPLDASDVFERDMNCSVERHSDHHVDVKADVSFVVDIQSGVGSMGISVKLDELDYSSVLFDGKKAKGNVLGSLRENGLDDEANNVYNSIVETVYDKGFGLYRDDDLRRVTWIEAQLREHFAKAYSVKRKVPFMRNVSLEGGYQPLPRKAKKKLNFTRRVTKMEKGKAVKRNTRVVFYAADPNASLHEAHVNNASMLVPDFGHYLMKNIQADSLASQSSELFDAADNVDLDSKAYAQWKMFGGIERAVSEHNSYLQERFKKRHLRGYTKRDVRQYGGTHVAETLMSNGPITVTPKYWPKVVRILKRTQIFNSLGLFRYQSWSYDEVNNLEFSVPMHQHRADKVHVVLEVRRLRNIQRAKAKRALQLMSVGLYSQAVVEDLQHNANIWQQTAFNAIQSMSHDYLSVLCKVRFDTGDVSAKQKARVSGLWVTWFMNDVTDAPTLIKKLVGAAQWRVLKDNPPAMDSAVNVVRQSLAPVLNQLKQVIAVWSPVLTNLTLLTTQPELSHDDVACGVVAEMPGDMISYDGFEFWRPNKENLFLGTGSMEKGVSNSLEQLSALVHILRGCQSAPLKSSEQTEQQLLLI